MFFLLKAPHAQRTSSAAGLVADTSLQTDEMVVFEGIS